MADGFDEALVKEMGAWEASGLRRRLDPEGVGSGIDFSSNDTLGLSRHPEVVAAAREAIARHGVGGRASRLLGGGSPAHAEAERVAAKWLRAEAALLFPSGYQANLGLVTSLVGRQDALVSDRLNHASLVDAARLSRARVHVHAHGDLNDLERCLERSAGARRRLVLTEGVFSMDGDASPLAAIHEICRRHDAWLVVDEAHSVGLLGPEGRGAWAAAGSPRDDRLAGLVITGGKALGVAGAFVVGSRALRDHVVNRARSFLYTTAAPPAVAGALTRAIELCRAADDARARTRDHAQNLADRLGLPSPGAAIVPVVIGDSELAFEVGVALQDQGFDVRAARPPTVPPDTARIRVVCHAFNTPNEVSALAEGLAPHVRAQGPATVRSAAGPRPLVVVGTDTGVGKTVVSALLLRSARARGPAAYWKPAQTGSERDTDVVAHLAGAKPRHLLPSVWTLARPASPHEAAEAEGRRLVPEVLARALRAHLEEEPNRQLLIELAGGLLVPYRADERRFTQADWLAEVGAETVLVARSGLGTLNHTLLTLEALRSRRLEPRALFLVGPPHASNRRTLAHLGGVGSIYEVPMFDELAPARLESWLTRVDLAPVWGA